MAVEAPITVSPDIPAIACCPNCGSDLQPPFRDTHSALLQAHLEIEDLQTQVHGLNQKASAAVARWAEYEDDLAKLRAALLSSQQQQQQQQQQQHRQPPTPPSAAAAASPGRASSLATSAASRISSLLGSRRSAPAVPVPVPVPECGDGDLAAALSRERALRRQAEGRLSDTSREVEELSVQLFEQANEMVASERRARAVLEERVGDLERRDLGRRRRLDRLESALERIGRAREVLMEVGGHPAATG